MINVSFFGNFHMKSSFPVAKIDCDQHALASSNIIKRLRSFLVFFRFCFRIFLLVFCCFFLKKSATLYLLKKHGEGVRWSVLQNQLTAFLLSYRNQSIDLHREVLKNADQVFYDIMIYETKGLIETQAQWVNTKKAQQDQLPCLTLLFFKKFC